MVGIEQRVTEWFVLGGKDIESQFTQLKEVLMQKGPHRLRRKDIDDQAVLTIGQVVISITVERSLLEQFVQAITRLEQVWIYRSPQQIWEENLQHLMGQQVVSRENLMTSVALQERRYDYHATLRKFFRWFGVDTLQLDRKLVRFIFMKDPRDVDYPISKGILKTADIKSVQQLIYTALTGDILDNEYWYPKNSK